MLSSDCRELYRRAIARRYRANNVVPCGQGLQVVVGLHCQPRRGIAREVARQSFGRVGSDAAALLHDFVNARHRYSERASGVPRWGMGIMADLGGGVPEWPSSTTRALNESEGALRGRVRVDRLPHVRRVGDDVVLRALGARQGRWSPESRRQRSRPPSPAPAWAGRPTRRTRSAAAARALTRAVQLLWSSRMRCLRSSGIVSQALASP